MTNKVEYIHYKKVLYALIIRGQNQFKKKGVNFVTKNEDLLQVGFIKHKNKHFIKPHTHIKKKRIINFCSEVLLLKKGILKIIFFNDKGREINLDKRLYKNDLIILFKGGHGFEVIKDIEMIEIKQGPYVMGKDKLLFDYDKKTNPSK